MKSIVSPRMSLQVLLYLLHFYSSLAEAFLLQARVSRPLVATKLSGGSQQPPVRLGAGPIALLHHRPTNQASLMQHQSRLVSMCQLPKHLLAGSKCRDMHESELNRSSMNEFQARLVESSQDVVHLLRSYREEFRSLSLDPVWLARQNTINRLQQLASINDQRAHYEWAARRLFESIYLHLNGSAANYPTLALEMELGAGSMSSGAIIERELNTFFKRLQLIQMKRLLDQSLPNSLDLECLEANLQSEKQIEQSLSESIAQLADGANVGGSLEQLKPQLALDRMRISVGIKQSLEFARTLLSSLNLATELFHNLTSQASEWMSHGSCHQALARMTVCQQCHTPYTPDSTTEQQQVPPCEGYCLNVVRGCINDVYELNSFWAQHVDLLTRFKMNMIETNNIENVMSTLDEKLVGFVDRLHQQYTSLINSNNQSNRQQQQQPAGQWLATAQHQTTISAKMARQCQSRSQSAAFRHGEARPASRVLPATQKQLWALGGWTHGYLAQRALQSPAHSLFNRLDTFVHELAGSRDFFAEWPQRLCRRIQEPQLASLSSVAGSKAAGECWNGRDFSGYTKPLVDFGKPLTGAHPEVPVSEPVAVNPTVLNLVAKLKLVGAQLARKSVRVPSLYDLLSAVAGGSTLLADPSSSAPVSAALASQLDPNANLMEPHGEQTGVDSSGSMNALAAAAVAAAASSSNPPGGLEEGPEERVEAEGESKTEAAQRTAEGGQEDEDEEAMGDGEEEAEEEDEGEVNCTQSDCSDLFNNVALPNGTTEQQVPIIDMDTNNTGLETSGPVLDNTPSIIVIPKPSEKLNPIYPYPILPNGQLNLSPNNQHHGSHHQHHLNPASTASTQNTLVVNLLLAMALGILLASLVCLRRLKLRL